MNPLLASAHRDVLSAPTPDNAASRDGLINELQSRGRAAVGAKSWMDAKMLYEKAIEVIESNSATDTPNEKLAMFSGNLSLVLRNMGEFEDARKAATKSTKADANYVKGWWRLGQALSGLKRSEDALEAMQQAKSLDPTNKALMKECDKLVKQVEEDKRLMEAMEVEETDPAAVVDEKKKTVTKTEAPPPKKTKPVTTATKTTTTTKDSENIFTKSDAVRGYKIVNGKKTSYFHNELSEEAKTLIGDIAPKKLENVEAVKTKTTEGTSAWNQAGTWEEKNVTSWADESLRKQIEMTTFVFPDSSPAPGALVTIQKVIKLNGHASVAQVRGKKRYIYEYSAELEWQLEDATNGMKCVGKVKIHDIDGTVELGEGYEQDGFTIDETSDNSVRPLVDRFVQRGGFKDSLNNSIDDWVRLFKETY